VEAGPEKKRAATATRPHLNESEFGLAVVTRYEHLYGITPLVPLIYIRISLLTRSLLHLGIKNVDEK
jgi:hypothetical protein